MNKAGRGIEDFRLHRTRQPRLLRSQLQQP